MRTVSPKRQDTGGKKRQQSEESMLKRSNYCTLRCSPFFWGKSTPPPLSSFALETNEKIKSVNHNETPHLLEPGDKNPP